MKKFNWLTLMLILVLVLPLSPAMAQVPDETDGPLPPPVEAEGNWFIVEFEDPSLAVYAKSGGDGISTMSVGGKLNVEAASSQAYIGQLEDQQAAFGFSLASVVPGARVERGYQIVLNAVAVQLPNDDLETLKKLLAMPGVKRISPQRIYTIDMDYSLDLINASAMWSQLGGQDAAGTGIKVAIVDSGIDPDHALFGGTGWSYPTTGTWPKGNAAFCNSKIIAARYYTPTFAVNAGEELTPQDHHGHGTHVGGTSVGNRVTASFGTSTPEISGVAPGAWIMAYKGLFLNEAGTGAGGSNIMLVGAVEDAIADGADVINNSWGSDAWELDDPLTAAYEAAVDAGIVVVFSAGNSGPDYNTVGSPNSSKFIDVGASTTKRAYYNTLEVTAPTPVSTTLQSFAATEMSDIDASAIPTTTIGPLPYLPTGKTGHLLTTAPELNGTLLVPTVTMGITQTTPYSSGWIAVIPRGTHSFSSKAANAKSEGAVAAVIYLPPGSGYADDDWKGGFTLQGEALYTVITGKEWGGGLVNWWKDNEDAARLQIGYPVSPFETETEDMIADFSSRGPGLGLSIRPDLVAPGVNILSGVWDGTYDVWGGTSMAAPHVTGAAALLLAQHPTWTPAQVKSALMTTASQTIVDTDKTTTADVMTQGSGRIDLSKAGNPGLTFDKPSHSFGMVAQGNTVSTLVTATDVSGAVETYTLSVQETVTDTGHVTVTVTPAALNVAAAGAGVFTVTVETDSGAATQDIEGKIVLSGTTHLSHIPYWARIYPPTTNTILLVDDDLSGLGNPDYQTYYANALTGLGLSYDIWDTTSGGWSPGFPTRGVLDRYDAIVYFAGDDITSFVYQAFGYMPAGSGSTEDLRSYLAAGGKMIAFGQDAAWALDYYLGAPLGAFFGMEYSADNAFGSTAIPQPSAVGVAPFLDGVMIDFNPVTGDGAGNMITVDSLDVPNYSDVSNTPLFVVPNTFPDTQGIGYLGSAQSSDLTLERDADEVASGWWKLAFRTTFCSFGLEAVNDNTGYYTRTALLGDLFNYVNDEVTVAFDAASYAVDASFTPVVFTATMASTVGANAFRYRWDFGDGSEYETTDVNNVTHQYMVPGIYYARVEATDEYGHTAVSDPVIVATGSVIYLPLVSKNY